MLTFVTASLVGGLLLSIPAASVGPGRAPVLTALFTATSATCVTGLAVVDTGQYWSGFGQWVILALIQVGGLGIMALTSLLVLAVGGQLGLRQRVIAAASTGSSSLGEVRRLLLGVAMLSLGVEALVALGLTLRFWISHDEALGRAAFLGLFHAVSAFNNAGFSVFGDSMMSLNEDPFILLVLSAAVVAGGLGFLAWVQIARNPRTPSRWSLHAKLTVVATIFLLVAGWALFAWFEWTNTRTLGPLSGLDSVVNAFFHSAMPRTAGFNSMDVADLREPSRFLTEILMVIGGGSGSTAGGIKVSTFALLGWVMWAESRGERDVVVFERRVPTQTQRQAVTVALAFVGTVVVATMALVATTRLPRADLQFEAISALGTVGLSTGVTPLLSSSSQVIVMVLMILGRVGPPTLFAALVLRQQDRRYRYPQERPLIG